MVEIQTTNPKAYELKALIKETEEEIKKYSNLTGQLEVYSQRRTLYEEIKEENKKIK